MSGGLVYPGWWKPQHQRRAARYCSKKINKRKETGLFLEARCPEKMCSARMPEQAIRVTVTTWICKLKIFMKIILLMSLVSLFLSPAFAGTAVKLSCSLRKSVTISKFHYKLSTMKWGDHFQVASGIRQAQTTGNVPFRVTRFQNGDDLVFFPDSEAYYFFYSGMATPDRCIVQETYSYPVVELPRYKKSE